MEFKRKLVESQGVLKIRSAMQQVDFKKRPAISKMESNNKLAVRKIRSRGSQVEFRTKPVMPRTKFQVSQEELETKWAT